MDESRYFGPGDRVVCVTAKPTKCWYVRAEYWLLRRGAIYTVAKVIHWKRTDHVQLEELDVHSGPRGWGAWRFRRIIPCSDAFREQMRALRPVKEWRPVPAEPA
ncbi:MAG: hypothetical protein ACT4OE_10305 [Sphingosinicella sp.]